MQHQGLDSAVLVEIGAATVFGFVLWIAAMIACPMIMSRKGRSGVLGFVLGLFLGVIGIIIAVLLPPADDHRLALRGSRGGFSRAEAERLDVPGTHGVPQEAVTQTCPSCGSKVPFGADICRVCQLAIPHGS